MRRQKREMCDRVEDLIGVSCLRHLALCDRVEDVANVSTS